MSKRVTYICDVCGKQIKDKGFLVIEFDDPEEADNYGINYDLDKDTLVCPKCWKLLLSRIGEVMPVPEGEVKHETPKEPIVIPEKVTKAEPVVVEPKPEKPKSTGKKPGPKPVTDVIKEGIVDDYLSGMTLGQVAKAHNTSPVVARAILAGRGFSMPAVKSNDPSKCIDIGKVMALKRAGNLPGSEIAAECGIPVWAIKHIMEHHEVIKEEPKS